MGETLGDFICRSPRKAKIAWCARLSDCDFRRSQRSAYKIADLWLVRYRRLNSSAFAKCAHSRDFLRLLLPIAGKVNTSGWSILSHEFSNLPLHLQCMLIFFISIRSPRASKRIRPTNSLNNTPALATFQLFHLALFFSLTTFLLQVVFGLPLACPSGTSSWSTPQCCKTVSFSPSFLSTCPNQFHLLRHTSQLISLISAISTRLLLVILCCHLIFIIRLRHWHWKQFSFRSSAFVIFHVSQPYSRTRRTKVLNSRIWVLLPIPLAAHTFPSLWNAPDLQSVHNIFTASTCPPYLQ